MSEMLLVAMLLSPLLNSATPTRNLAPDWTGFHIRADSEQLTAPHKEAYFEDAEGVCRSLAKQQAAAQEPNAGAIIDPILKREHQYTTPYFAFAVGALLHAGRAEELRNAGILAMDWATDCISKHKIPEEHGEFFIAPLAEALDRYEGHAPPETISTWRARLQVPIEKIIKSKRVHTNNWRTYAMKGEWTRYKAKLISHQDAVDFIEDAWLHRTQRERIALDPLCMYQDRSSDPQSMAVEAVGRGNLLALAAHGYDGPSSPGIAQAAFTGTATSLLFQDPTGQCPPNGRTDDHVFNDVLYLICSETMAGLCRESNPQQAGQYRRAAELAHQSIQRWKRTDPEWAGSFYVTKNHLDPADRVGYQPASQYSNYNAAIAYHLIEAAEAAVEEIVPRPAPCEIGGYILQAGAGFDCFAANAGGLQLFGNLRGDTVPKYGICWSPLGLCRIARADWDSRLGPSDATFDASSNTGLSFGPAWKTKGKWTRLAQEAKAYRGALEVEFVHPLLLRFAVRYSPVSGNNRPAFRQEFIVTPSGVMTRLSCTDIIEFGLSIPILENDGNALKVNAEPDCVTTRYPGADDMQCFIAPNGVIAEDGDPILSSYGYLRPYRVTSTEKELCVFVYPRKKGEPEISEFQNSLKVTTEGFRSALGTVEGNCFSSDTLIGGEAAAFKTSAGLEMHFDSPCQFILTLQNNTPAKIETGQSTTLTLDGRAIALQPHTPTAL